MTSFRNLKIEALLINIVAEYFTMESGNTSLITVTKCIISDNGNYASIYISVFQESRADAALDFANRKRRDLRDFMSRKMRSRGIPQIEFLIDKTSNLGE